MTEDQQAVHWWIDETFPGADPESPRKSIRALEEMVELCLASGASPSEISGAITKSLNANGHYCHFLDGWPKYGTAHPDKISAEAADVLIEITEFALPLLKQVLGV